jgi:predicted Zn-dependent peptidase
MQTIQQHTFSNGLTLLCEPMSGVQSAAMTLLTPAGIASQPADRQGVAPVLAEMMQRGAGGKSARDHSDALDRLGIQRGVESQSRYLRIGATMIGFKVAEALPLLLDMLRAPNLDADQLAPSVDLSLQALDALADEPQRRAMLELRKKHYPGPINRSPYGERTDLQGLRNDDVRAFWADRFKPQGSVIAFAGAVDFESLCDLIEQELGGWEGQAKAAEVPKQDERAQASHETADTTQVHIALAYRAVELTHPDRVLQQAVAAVLSGGMSGRLFTEVREKRGLCYAVSASYAGMRERGDMMAYAGTTAPRAQETLDVLVQELRRIHEGVSDAELQRALVGMKSRLVMQGESSGARASSIATDHLVYGKPRSLQEAAEEVDAVTLERVNTFLQTHVAQAMTVVTLGPEPLDVPEGFAAEASSAAS